MITAQHTVEPAALLMARGGSAVAAQRITGAVLQRIVDAGGARNGLAPRAAWVAIVVKPGRHADTAPDALDVVVWDPDTPIPEYTFQLRCTGYTVSTTPEPQQ
jgi:hypothetical protein